jgi:hypothetical protein
MARLSLALLLVLSACDVSRDLRPELFACDAGGTCDDGATGDSGVMPTNCPIGNTCRCEEGDECAFRCFGGCTVECLEGSLCEVLCQASTCTNVCATGSECHMTCSSANCNTTCAEGASCDITCEFPSQCECTGC